MFQFINSLKDPRTLGDHELEPTFINLKNSILAKYPSSFNRNSNDIQFRRLYEKINSIVAVILERHSRYMIECEAAMGRWDKMFLFEKCPEIFGQADTYKSKASLSFGEISNEALFFLSLFSYIGGYVKNVGFVNSEPLVALKAVEYLADQRNYDPAIFFKGVILKYGEYPDLPPKLSESKRLLEFAASKGVGGAVVELRNFGLHERDGRYAWR